MDCQTSTAWADVPTNLTGLSELVRTVSCSDFGSLFTCPWGMFRFQEEYSQHLTDGIYCSSCFNHENWLPQIRLRDAIWHCGLARDEMPVLEGRWHIEDLIYIF